MGIRKFLVGALLMTPMFAFATPVSAAATSGRDVESATFTTRPSDEDITCRVEASISFRYVPEDDRTEIRALNQSLDSGCREVILRTDIWLTWRREDNGREENASSFATDTSVTAAVWVSGQVSDIRGVHHWAYLCEQSPDDSCDVTLDTSPK